MHTAKQRERIESAWAVVIKELEQRNCPEEHFYFIDSKPHTCKQKREENLWRQLMKTVRLVVRAGAGGKRFYLGENYPKIYLTYREAELSLLLEEYTYREISKMMGISRRTVEYYTSNVKKKFNCNSKRNLVYVIRESGLLDQLRDEVDVTPLIKNLYP